MVRNFGGRPGRSKICYRAFLLTVSNALVRSTNVTCSPLFCSQHFSWSCLRTNTISVVLLLALKPHYISGRWLSAIPGTSLFRSTLARILPAMERWWSLDTSSSWTCLPCSRRGWWWLHHEDHVVIYLGVSSKKGARGVYYVMLEPHVSKFLVEFHQLLQPCHTLTVYCLSCLLGTSSNSVFTAMRKITESWTVQSVLKSVWKGCDHAAAQYGRLVSKERLPICTAPETLSVVWGSVYHREGFVEPLCKPQCLH